MPPIKMIDSDSLEKYISLLIGLCTIIYWLVKFAISVVNFSLIKNVKAGIYNGYWVDPIKKEINCEILRVRKTISGIKAKPIYKHKAFHDYKVSLRPYHLNRYIFGGQWEGPKNTIYKGYNIFVYSIEDDTFSGKWIGPKSNLDVNSGDWFMIYFTEAKNPYLNYRKFRKLHTLQEKLLASPSILTNIIHKHETFPDRTCKVKNIKLNLLPDSFIPLNGKISVPLAEYIASVVTQSDIVLDLGTGTGFYPIYLAKNKGCFVKGVDIYDHTITLARQNSVLNGVENLTEFNTCSKTELFSSIKQSEKFDFIIANLPFTRISKSYQSRKSAFYTSFSGSINLLEQLILGAQYHIKPKGKLIFCYGNSGYMDLLQSIVKISSWENLKIVRSITEKDEIFHIIELELSDKVKTYYQKLTSEQETLAFP